MTAEGDLWKKLINPKNLPYHELLRSWTGYFYDVREKINIEQVATADGFKDDIYFSDERLIRRLLRESPVPIINVPRGYADFLESTIDRATVDSKTGEWKIDMSRMDEYVNAHMARPYEKYKEQIDMLGEYVKNKYAKR